MADQVPIATQSSESSAPLVADLVEQLAALRAELAESARRRDELERTLAAERVQLARSFELFERDRRMLGFEIHDGIVQDLTAALMCVQAGINDLQERRVGAPESLPVAERVIAKCIHEARRMMGGLQPPQLSEHGLIVAIEALAEEVRQRGVEVVRVNVDRAIGHLAPPLEVAVYRAIQESLNNVWQHGRARRAEVEVRVEAGEIRLVVRDDGVGFDTTAVGKHHYGLLGIRERAGLFGGAATIESLPGRGTTVRVSLPLA